MVMDSRLGLNDTMPFSKKYKGMKIVDIYKQDVGFLLWLRDAKAKGGEHNGKVQSPNRAFFDEEVLTLLNETLRRDYVAKTPAFAKFGIWEDIKAIQEDDAPFEPAVESKDFYTEWGTF